jgi:hypothetical protein
MKKILPIMVIGLVVLGGIGAVAVDNAKKSTEIVEVNGGFGQLSVVVENTGDICINNLECHISIEGGILGKINIKDHCNINFIGYKSTEVSKTNKMVFGFGRVKINIDVDYAEPWAGNGFVFGPFILVNQKL